MTDDLKKAELAAHRYDGLGAPMTYRPHIAELRRQVLADRKPIPERFSCEPVDGYEPVVEVVPAKVQP
ncbi:MAG: hypothetical protein E5V64_06685 [Mesorhizobium sp.]|uniref:hypothetical protein n=1 Tax=Mesorhizobium sp. TaxID=1871066 RepID=UPI00122AA1AC|nr:hypothetical protein [Mesorhizobium sp.]TIV83846.1 MAG: hypothetical protein E5V64_06685 [Mesorhizobium sp.]